MTDKTEKDMREATLARIRALMAKTTDNGCTEAEAKSAAAAVDRLLALYEVDMDELSVREQACVQMPVKIGKHAVRFAAYPIAGFTDCMVWASDDGLVYFGFQVDTEIAEYLTLLFQRAITRESTNFTMFNQDFDEARGSGQADMIRSFERGMAARLGDRLGELKSKRDFAQRTSGRDLVMMKKPVVDAAFLLTGIVLNSGRGRVERIRDAASYRAGRNAAEGVSISQGIGARAAQGGRIRG